VPTCNQIIFPLFCLLLLGCTKWDLDRVEFTEVITIGVIDVGSNSAFLLGDIENLRGSTLSEVGFLVSPVYFEDFEFRINNQELTRFLTASQSDISENRAFATAASGLNSGQKYFFRAYGVLTGEKEPVYGLIDSFTTIGFNVNIQEFTRRGSECPTEASILLKVDIRGVLPSAVKFGIVWQHDIFSDPTLDDNVILADQITVDGTATILLPVLCDKLYRVRSFIHLSDNEVLYHQAVEFTSEPGGVWEYVGEIPEQFTRSQGFRSFSLDQQGYVIGIRKELFQETFWKFDSKSQSWSTFERVPGGFNPSLWIPSSSDKILAASSIGLSEYFPSQDKWELLGDLPPAINRKVGFEFQNLIYFLDEGDMGFVRLSEPSTFVSLAEFPGTDLPDIAFRIGMNGYLAMGGFSQIPFDLSRALWKFNLESNLWEAKAEFPDPVFSRIGFSMNGKGYILSGLDEDLNPHPGFWEYDPDRDEWTRLSDFGRGDGNADVGFVIEGSAYGGLGISLDGEERQEFWKYIQELR